MNNFDDGVHVNTWPANSVGIWLMCRDARTYTLTLCYVRSSTHMNRPRTAHCVVVYPLSYLIFFGRPDTNARSSLTKAIFIVDTCGIRLLFDHFGCSRYWIFFTLRCWFSGEFNPLEQLISYLFGVCLGYNVRWEKSPLRPKRTYDFRFYLFCDFIQCIVLWNWVYCGC